MLLVLVALALVIDGSQAEAQLVKLISGAYSGIGAHVSPRWEKDPPDLGQSGRILAGWSL